MLGNGQVLVPRRVLFQFLFGKVGHILAIYRNHLVFLVEQFDVLRLPLILLQLAEKDESAVTINVDIYALHSESLSDSSLHLADAAAFFEADISECATLPVGDEIAIFAAFDGDIDEFVNRETTGPSCGMVNERALPASSLFGQLTSPDIGALLSEEAAVIMPFREVSVHWPALTKLNYGLTCKFLFGAAIDMIAEG